MTEKDKKSIIDQIEKIECDYVAELKKHILSYSKLFSEFEKLNLLKREGSNLLVKDHFYSRDNYRYLEITEYIIFDFDKKRFTYRNKREKPLQKNEYRTLFTVDLDLEKKIEVMRKLTPASNFQIDSKKLNTFFRLIYKCKVDFSFLEFKKFLVSEITEEEFDKVKRKIYREMIFNDCKEYLNRNRECEFKDFLKQSHIDKKYIEEIFLEKDYGRALIKKTIEMLNV